VVSARFLLYSNWIFFVSSCDLLYPLGSRMRDTAVTRDALIELDRFMLSSELGIVHPHRLNRARMPGPAVSARQLRLPDSDFLQEVRVDP